MYPPPTTTRAADLIRLAWVAGGLVAAFVLGMAARGLLDPSNGTITGSGPLGRPPTSTSAEGAGRAGRAGPTAMEAGVPIGYTRSREGAVAAAVSYVRTGQAFLDMDSSGVQRAVRTMAASGSTEAQLAETSTKLAATREALTGSNAPIEYHQAILAVRVDAFTPERSRVAVWNVGVLSRQGAAPPQAGWAVSTFDLVWERGDWKVWAESIVPGPAPITNNAVAPATSAELRARLAGFTDYGATR